MRYAGALMRPVYAGLFFSVVFIACGRDEPAPASKDHDVMTDPDRTPGVSSFKISPAQMIELCLDRLLGRRDTYYYTLEFTANDGFQHKCFGFVSNEIGKEPTLCHTLSPTCTNRFTPHEEAVAVAQHLIPGAVKEARLSLGQSYDPEHAKKFVFQGLQ
jgi:hypothetical protein